MQLVASSATRALLHLHQAVSKPLRQHDASHATLNTLFQGCGSDWSLAEPSQILHENFGESGEYVITWIFTNVQRTEGKQKQTLLKDRK